MSLASDHSLDMQRSLSSSSDHSSNFRHSDFGTNRLGGGQMLFTGPDGIRDHRQRVVVDYRFIGEGTMSPEGSSECGYLWRSPVNTPHPRPKSRTVGEVGWGVADNFNWFSSADTGAQIQLGEFRQFAEDRHTHIYQSTSNRSQETDNKSESCKRPDSCRSKSIDSNGSSTGENQRYRSPTNAASLEVIENRGTLDYTKSGEDLLPRSKNSMEDQQY